MQIDLVALIVDEYDRAIAFFTDVLGFDLIEDSPSLTNDGRPKRWVVVRPPAHRPGFFSPAPTVNARVLLSVTRQPAESASFFASKTSTRRTSG